MWSLLAVAAPGSVEVNHAVHRDEGVPQVRVVAFFFVGLPRLFAPAYGGGVRRTRAVERRAEGQASTD